MFKNKFYEKLYLRWTFLIHNLKTREITRRVKMKTEDLSTNCYKFYSFKFGKASLEKTNILDDLNIIYFVPKPLLR